MRPQKHMPKIAKDLAKVTSQEGIQTDFDGCSNISFDNMENWEKK